MKMQATKQLIDRIRAACPDARISETGIRDGVTGEYNIRGLNDAALAITREENPILAPSTNLLGSSFLEQMTSAMSSLSAHIDSNIAGVIQKGKDAEIRIDAAVKTVKDKIRAEIVAIEERVTVKLTEIDTALEVWQETITVQINNLDDAITTRLEEFRIKNLSAIEKKVHDQGEKLKEAGRALVSTVKEIQK